MPRPTTRRSASHGAQDHPKAHHQPGLHEKQPSLSVCSTSSTRPRKPLSICVLYLLLPAQEAGGTVHYRGSLFIMQKKKIINHFWTVLIPVKQFVKNGATPSQEVLVCVDLLGTDCMAQGAGHVFVQKKASPGTLVAITTALGSARTRRH